jgi:hypothetical protein
VRGGAGPAVQEGEGLIDVGQYGLTQHGDGIGHAVTVHCAIDNLMGKLIVCRIIKMNNKKY